MLRAIHEIRPVGSLVRTLVASSRWYSPARRLTWDVSPLCSEEDQPVYRKREEYVVETICRDLEREGIYRPAAAYSGLCRQCPAPEDRYGLLPTPMARDCSPRGANSLQKGLPEIIREMLLPTPTATEIHHRQRVERWKSQGRTSMHGAEDGEKNPNGLTDFLDFHGLLPTPTARDWKGAPTLEHFARKGKNPQQGSLPDFFAQAGRSFQLNPLFVAEMMGLPVNWTVLPFLPGGSSPSKGYGNAIVPQVIHEIFKAIESTYKQ